MASADSSICAKKAASLPLADGAENEFGQLKIVKDKIEKVERMDEFEANPHP